MRTPAALCSILAILAACGGRAADKYKTRAVKMVDELAAIGVAIDRSALSFEIGFAGKSARDLDRQQDMFFGPGHFEGLWALRQTFGLIATESPASLRKAAVAGVGGTVSAYYQSDRKALVFQQNTLSKLNDLDALVTHELVHAHQDQQPGGIHAYVKRDTLDATKAAHALLEGGAELIAATVMLRRSGKDTDSLTEATFDGALNRMLVGEEMAALYELGARHMLRALRAGAWKPGQPLPAPPSSTEQLMHPEKLGVDAPTPVELPTWSGGERVATNVVGELLLYYLVLEATGDRSAMQRVAAGWDGDLFHAYRTAGGGWGLAWRTVWDRAEDAASFHEVMLGRSDDAILRGQVVDVVGGSDASVVGALRAHLDAAPLPPTPPATDAAGTADSERALDDARARAPYVQDGVWIHADLGVRVPVPEGYAPQELRGTHLLANSGAGGFVGNITVVSMSNLAGHTLADHRKVTLEQLGNLGLRDVRAELGRHGDLDVMRFEYRGQFNGQPPTVRGLGILALLGDKQVIVTATVADTAWADEEARIRAALEGVTLR